MKIHKGADTSEKRMKFLYRRQAKLIELHNKKARELPLAEFRIWQSAAFRRLLKDNQFAIHEEREHQDMKQLTKEQSSDLKCIGLEDDSWDYSITLETS